MFGLLKALGLVKAALAVGALTAATTFAATQVVLPAASATGQSHATAGAASASPAASPAVPDVSTGKDVPALVDRLTANEQRLIANLEDVLARLEANPNVNDHAKAAIQAVIDRLNGGTVGLDRASQAVQGHPAPAAPRLPPQAQASPVAPQVSLPPQASQHPTPTDHPGQP